MYVFVYVCVCVRARACALVRVRVYVKGVHEFKKPEAFALPLNGPQTMATTLVHSVPNKGVHLHSGTQVSPHSHPLLHQGSAYEHALHCARTFTQNAYEHALHYTRTLKQNAYRPCSSLRTQVHRKALCYAQMF